jgi:hypothetical protein
VWPLVVLTCAAVALNADFIVIANACGRVGVKTDEACGQFARHLVLRPHVRLLCAGTAALDGVRSGTEAARNTF